MRFMDQALQGGENGGVLRGEPNRSPHPIPGAATDHWCERGDSNPHGFPRQILSLVRLPIPPLSHSLQYIK